MPAFGKRTNDDLELFVIVSGHEHRTLAPDPTIGTRKVEVEHADVLSAVYENRECDHFHLSPDAELLITESEV